MPNQTETKVRGHLFTFRVWTSESIHMAQSINPLYWHSSLLLSFLNVLIERTKEILMTQITTMVWSLTYSQTSWSVKSSGPLEALLWTVVVEVMAFQLFELFQILKGDAVKVLHSIRQQIWKTQQWPQDWKRSVFIPISKKGNAKQCSNYHTIALIPPASKVMLKVLQARLQ